MRIGIAFDLAPAVQSPHDRDDRFEEYDKPETVEAIAAVLRDAGHEVVLLGDGRELIAAVLADPPDLVWNLAEGEGVGRCREARVPAVLEMLGIPYTGSDPLALAASLDKPVAKTLVAGLVDVPRGLLVAAGRSVVDVEAELGSGACGAGPWIVKPAFEGSSKGIRDRSLVDDSRRAAALAVGVAREYGQPTLVEEFISGDEVTVGLVGNGDELQVLGTMRVRPKSGDPRFVYSLEVKRIWEERIEFEVPARLSSTVTDRVVRAARASFEALGCRDMARVDFRVRDGVPYFLEVNPLPGLAPEWSDLTIIAKGMGVGHSDLIGRILRAAIRRLGMDGRLVRGGVP